MQVDPQLQVLIVNEQKTMLRILRSMLRQIGFDHITEAGGVSAALLLLRDRRFGLVISDANLQGGDDLLRELRADKALAGLPLLMLTAESRPEEIKGALQSGAGDYIVKPFNAATFKNKITGLLERS